MAISPYISILLFQLLSGTCLLPGGLYSSFLRFHVVPSWFHFPSCPLPFYIAFTFPPYSLHFSLHTLSPFLLSFSLTYVFFSSSFLFFLVLYEICFICLFLTFCFSCLTFSTKTIPHLMCLCLFYKVQLSYSVRATCVYKSCILHT